MRRRTARPRRRPTRPRVSAASASSTSATWTLLEQVGQVQTCRGSHTHTLVTDKHNKKYVYIYVQHRVGVRPPEELAGCDANNTNTPTGDNPSKWRIEIIKVPLAAPEDAEIVNEPRLFADPATGAVNGLQNAPQTPNHPSGMAWGPTPITDACHDITVYAKYEIAAGACEGNGLLIDISNPAKPKRIDAVADPLYVLARGDVQQRRQDGRVHGRVGRRYGRALPCDRPAQLGRQIDLRHRPRQVVFRSYYKIPPVQTTQENCVSHIAGPGARARHLRPGVVPGRRVAGRLQRLEQPCRDRLLRPRPTSLVCSAASGRPTGTTARPTARRSHEASMPNTDALSENEIEAAEEVQVGRLNVQNQDKLEGGRASRWCARSSIGSSARVTSAAGRTGSTTRSTSPSA